MILDEILQKLNGLPEKDKEEVLAAALEDTKHMAFIPLEGPQTAAYLSEADVLLFGGSPGGGKTALECGLAINEHHRALIVRKNFVDLAGVLHTLDNILGKPDSAVGGNRPRYRKKEGGVIDFMGVGDDMDGKQGNPHDLICVGKKTPVLMADGDYKAAQDVRPGDMVATLEGPRKVINAFVTLPKEAVRITLPDGTSQIQSATHKLLTTSGWLDSRDVFRPSETCVPTEFGGVCRFSAQSGQTSPYISQPRAPLFSSQQQGGAGLLLLANAGIQTPTRIPHRWSYAHPYTGGERQSELLVRASSCEISPVGALELFDLEVEEVNHFITLGGFVNKNCIDEAAQIPEKQVRMLIGWLRTDRKGQRCRVVLGSNPPLDNTGDWLVPYFAPWLDPQHPNPAQEGELRYFLPDPEGGDRECGADEFTLLHGIKVRPQSRTFISSKFTDNPYYDPEQYAKSLAGLPEEVRESLITGNFMTLRADDLYQTIPTKWAQAAQARWTDVPPVGVPMCAIGVDIAQGGADNLVLAKRHDGWFAPLIVVPGKQVPDGKVAAGIVVANRRDDAKVIVDIGGGWGGDCYAHLRENDVDATSYMGVKKSTRRTVDGQLKFFNVRSEAYWRFREALDPSQPQGSPISLPRSAMLLSDLCAPTYEITPNGIKIESKESVCDRLKRSTDEGDAVVMAWWDGLKQVNVKDGWKKGRTLPKVLLRR